jgi:hypothetical protein
VWTLFLHWPSKVGPSSNSGYSDRISTVGIQKQETQYIITLTNQIKQISSGDSDRISRVGIKIQQAHRQYQY